MKQHDLGLNLSTRRTRKMELLITAANFNDVTQAHVVVQGEEILSLEVNWHLAIRLGKRQLRYIKVRYRGQTKNTA